MAAASSSISSAYPGFQGGSVAKNISRQGQTPTSLSFFLPRVVRSVGFIHSQSSNSSCLTFRLGNPRLPFSFIIYLIPVVRVVLEYLLSPTVDGALSSPKSPPCRPTTVCHGRRGRDLLNPAASAPHQTESRARSK